MARTGTLDPLSTFRFIVHIQIDGDPNSFQRLGFESVTAPRIDIQKAQYRELGRHLSPRNIVEGATFSPITMRRGKSYSADFYDWIGRVYRAFYGDSDGNSGNYRANIVIDHHDRSGKIVKKYVLINASPTMYIPASNFDAADDTSVSVETMMLDYEGFIELSLDYSAVSALAGEAVGQLVSPTAKLSPGFTPEINAELQSVNVRKTSSY